MEYLIGNAAEKYFKSGATILNICTHNGRWGDSEFKNSLDVKFPDIRKQCFTNIFNNRLSVNPGVYNRTSIVSMNPFIVVSTFISALETEEELIKMTMELVRTCKKFKTVAEIQMEQIPEEFRRLFVHILKDSDIKFNCYLLTDNM